MKEHGTLFNRDMVLALLAGTKTNTRRALKVQPPANTVQFCTYHHPDPRPHHWAMDGGSLLNFTVPCPYGQAGDRLYVKETFFAFGRWETRHSPKKKRDEWHFIDMTLETGQSYLYAADGITDTQAFIKRRGGVTPMYWKRPAIFMPRVAARILLEITSVRVERLQDISEADARAEGCEPFPVLPEWSEQDLAFIDPPLAERENPYRNGYAILWDAINGAGVWAANPWVWVVSFKVASS